jgi:hypothetical protein
MATGKIGAGNFFMVSELQVVEKKTWYGGWSGNSRKTFAKM